VLACVLLAGCQGEKDNAAEGSRIERNLAKLSPADRKLADEQRFCAVETENRLGEMGVPVKITIKGQPVFLCCKGCRKIAEDDPQRTLGIVQKLKAATAAELGKDTQTSQRAPANSGS